jgi:hypothetical protein
MRQVSACSRDPALSAGSGQGLTNSKVTGCLSETSGDLSRHCTAIVDHLSLGATGLAYPRPGAGEVERLRKAPCHRSPRQGSAFEWALPDHKASQIDALQPLEE